MVITLNSYTRGHEFKIGLEERGGGRGERGEEAEEERE